VTEGERESDGIKGEMFLNNVPAAGKRQMRKIRQDIGL